MTGLNLSGATIERLRKSFALPIPEPVSVRDVLEDNLAVDVLNVLRDVNEWRREYFVERFLGGTEKVDMCTFDEALEVEQFASWSTVNVSDIAGGPAVGRLLDLFTNAGFSELLSNLGRPVARSPSVKLRRYGPGDFFGSHCDGEVGVGVLFHLTDPAWRDGHGGRLMHEPHTGRVRKLPPHFNSAVFLPYTLQATHRVEPVRSPEATRYTFGFDYA